MKDECLKPTVKHGGGSIMVLGSFAANGVGDLIRIDGIMNAEKYWQILFNRAIPFGKRLIGNGFIFQRDSDPKLTAIKVKSYLLQKEHLLYNCRGIFLYYHFFVGYILSFGLVRHRTVRLSARVRAHIERRCSDSRGGRNVTITDVIIKTPDRK